MNLLTLVWLAAILSSIKASTGPQTPLEIAQARKALLGNGDDEVTEIGVSPNDKMARIRVGPSLWTGGVVPYVISPDLEKHRGLILQAMDQYHRLTCIRFVPRTYQSSYVQLKKGERCSSNLGKIGGKQEINLGDGCFYIGTIVHQLGLAIGLSHEYNRPDRNKYIMFFGQNIKKDYLNQFRIKETNRLTPYNYDSIMHHGNYAFSSYPNYMTMVARNGRRLLEPYEKTGLDYIDIVLINGLYKHKPRFYDRYSKKILYRRQRKIKNI